MSNVKRPSPEFSGVILKGHKAIPRYLFTANQMEAYANERVREALEQAAGICDRFADRGMHPAECAGAIRALITKE